MSLSESQLALLKNLSRSNVSDDDLELTSKLIHDHNELRAALLELTKAAFTFTCNRLTVDKAREAIANTAEESK